METDNDRYSQEARCKNTKETHRKEGDRVPPAPTVEGMGRTTAGSSTTLLAISGVGSDIEALAISAASKVVRLIRLVLS